MNGRISLADAAASIASLQQHHPYFKDGWKRWLYRTAMEGILPDSVRRHQDKHDSAMARQGAAIHRSTRDRWHERLRDERENPYVDIDCYVRASQTAVPRAAGQARSSKAMWLPFTKAVVP